MANLNEWFTVHSRKRVDRTPLTDWAGRPMPKTLIILDRQELS